MTKPLIIAVAPNGARRTKADHPALPIDPREIGLEAARCREAGAAMIHLHVRDAEERHSLDVDRYRAAVAAVRREAPEMICQVTTEAVGLYAPHEQVAAMRALRPEAFSVALRELFAEPDDEAAGAAFLAEQAGAGTLVQHILYDAGDVTRFQGLVARGLIPLERASVLFVLGRYAPGQRSDPADLLPFLAAWQETGHHLDLPWALCAFGRREAACMIAAAALGGHVRVGFENNLWRPDGSLAADNAAQVAEVAGLARAVGLDLADPAAARALLAGEA
ncbi:3-keto-5-aminohexanoate cleavage enzyme [Methylobacterium crusticola]|uniref:3-keto-5-aminohexanoate cleavage enzyme n=1 Tax=Methylobacterium crusticola TaxID=1697972 RepID=A0ABQ4QV63_9HYPH|nr:3-keto-5-aminohexanoate cleavage protein [Methylobacterium crusticola]GJD48785.1 3-keto-5-aminohexanoate cleavage enzyme [Methylobacterium crusticola]